ncbi:DUF3267 domain-containing protein [Phocaeicola sp.]
MENKEIKGQEHTLTANRANALSFLFLIPVGLITILPYLLIWGTNRDDTSSWIYLTIPLGIIAHELIHGLTWANYAPNGFKDISFGFKWEALMPYCHCKTPLTVRQYGIGAIMPTLILGLIPYVIGMAMGNSSCMIFAAMLLLGGSGDMMILWMMRKLPKDTKVMDHPSKPGFYIPEEG